MRMMAGPLQWWVSRRRATSAWTEVVMLRRTGSESASLSCSGESDERTAARETKRKARREEGGQAGAEYNRCSEGQGRGRGQQQVGALLEERGDSE